MATINFADYYTPHARQLEAHKSEKKYKGVGGAMAGGKSRFGCAEMIQLCLDYLGNRVGIFRKNRSVLKRTTMVTFFAICPPDLIANYNKSDLIVDLHGGSQIVFAEADITKDPTLEKLKSLELGAYFFDEGTEVPEEVFRMLATRITDRWTLPDGTRPREEGIVSFNPEPGWCEGRFITNLPTNHSFTQFLMKDNPYITRESIQELMGILTEAEIEKWIHGTFLHTDDPNQLISFAWVKNCLRSEGEVFRGEGKQSLGVDVARFGDDHTVLARSMSNGLADIDGYPMTSIYTTTELVKAKINEHSIDHDRVVVDALGLGGGVYDYLYNAHYRVKEFVGGKPPTKRLKYHRFKDMSAQGWWYLREQIRTGEFELIDHTRLKEDLTAVRYSISGEKLIEVESKDKLKKRIGRSPDYGDATMMSLMPDFLGGGVITQTTLI